MTIQAVTATPTILSWQSRRTVKEVEHNKLIEELRERALNSSNPEIHYQAMALAHFKCNRPHKALKAVLLAEEWAEKNGTLSSIYPAILKKAAHLYSVGTIQELEQVKEDLLKLKSLTEIPEYRKCEINDYYRLVNEQLSRHERRVRTQNMEKNNLPYYKGGQVAFKPYVENIDYARGDSLYYRNISAFLKDYWWNDQSVSHRQSLLLEVLKRKFNQQEHDNVSNQIKVVTNCLADLFNYLNDPFLHDDAVCEIYARQDILNNIIENKNADRRQVALCHYYKGEIFYKFKLYLDALTHFSIAVELDGNIKFSEEIIPLQNKHMKFKDFLAKNLMAMDPLDRLDWIDKALDSKQEVLGKVIPTFQKLDALENPGVPTTSKRPIITKVQELLLWKAEAHFLLDQHVKGREAAQALLALRKFADTYANRTKQYSELIFRMASSHSDFKFSDL